MSAAEIIQELPKLTAEERSAVRRSLRELEERDELLFLHDSADARFQDMDNQEAGFQTIADTGNAHGRFSRQGKI